MATKIVTFIKDHKVQQHDGNGPHYRSGTVHTLELSYADKYVRRGYAVEGDITKSQNTEEVAPGKFVAVHRGLGRWEVTDETGAVVSTDLNKQEAKDRAAELNSSQA